MSIAKEAEMKKILVIFAVLLAIFFVGCPISPPIEPEVEEYKPTDLKASNASTVPTTEAEIVAMFEGAPDMSGDPLVLDLEQFFTDFQSEPKASDSRSSTKIKSAGARALALAKDLSSSLQEQLEALEEAISDFPTTKSLDQTIDVNGEDIGSYLTFTKGEATLKADAQTVDDEPIDENISNITRFSGSNTLKVEINPKKAFYDCGSAIKDLKLKTNVSGDLTMTTKTVESAIVPDKLTLNYSESFALGFSVNFNGTGGKIVIKQDASHSGDIDIEKLNAAMEDMEQEDPQALEELLLPTFTIEVKVYDDQNTVQFSKTYTSLEEFGNAFSPPEQD